MLKNWEVSDKDSIKQGHGLIYQGTVTTYTDSTHFACLDLAGFGNDFFVNAGYTDWDIYALWDKGGAGAAPQGLMTRCSDYVSSTGTFTHTAFASGTLAVGDKVLLIHPVLAMNARNVSCMVFPSAPTHIVVIPGTGADLAFPSVVVAGLPTGCNILRVDAALAIGALFDTSAAENQIKTGTTDELHVKLSTDAWTDGSPNVMAALVFPALGLQVDASAYRGGAVLFGGVDIKAVVDGNGTYNFRSDETTATKGVEATGATLELLDVTTILRVWFS